MRWVLVAAVTLALAAAGITSAQTSTPSGGLLTAAEASFKSPDDWKVDRTDALVRVVAPEGDVSLTIVDVGTASDAAAATVAAWRIAQPEFARTIRLSTPQPAREGWNETVQTDYETSPNEKRVIVGIAFRHDKHWTVLLLDGAYATLGKRSAAVNTMLDSMRPVGYRPETFVGLTPHKLDPARIAALKKFLSDSMSSLRIPGIGFAFIQDGKIIDEGGLGVRELGKQGRVDANTRFMIASNTKGMTTLLLAQLVDQGKLRWDEPVIDAYPGFRLADPATTRSILVRHLVCACTGMPRQDMEWIMTGGLKTPASRVAALLATMKPTSGFGEMYQYSNLLAAEAGYVAGHVIYPGMEVGAAYDRAMRERIFGPLGMRSTTFDKKIALTGNHAAPHGDDFNGKVAVGSYEASDSIYFARPAGGAWSTAHDLALYALDELNEGKLDGSGRLLSPANLLARRNRGVSAGEGKTYGMGLENNERYGVRVISHGGAMPGYMTNWMIIPEAGIGVVILTNANNGRVLIDGAFMRRLLELVYDGKPEAEGDIEGAAKALAADAAADRKRLTVPADPAAVARLAERYSSPELGRIHIRRTGGLVFDFGSFSSPIVTRRNPDGTTSFVMTDPVLTGWSLTSKPMGKYDALVMRDAQHEYVYLPAT